MRLFAALVVLLSYSISVQAQRSAVDEDGHMVDFVRDIAPIFKRNCLECHGLGESKGDFDIENRDNLMDYVEAGDADESSLMADYLLSDDEDMLMPPETQGGPLQPSELALIRVWIEEGAKWPDGYQLAETPDAVINVPADTTPPSLIARIWSAQGFLHPATVHFPIALLTLGAGFVVLGWRWPAVGTQIPLACLIIGALSSIAATAMGWSFAVEQGYGSWNQFDAAAMEKEVFWHRWSGMIVTILSVIFAVIALVAVKKDSPKLTFTWKLGLLICAGIVGAVGHQGGEMSYGEDFYPKMFRTLLGQPANQEMVEAELQDPA